MNMTEQQASQWEAMHEIENIMGRYSFLTMLIKDAEVFEKFWSHDDPCLGMNDGYYIGYEAVKGYFDARRTLADVRAAAAKAAYPEQLGGMDEDELRGVGALHAPNMCTPVIEVASDLKTAKGLWFLMGGEVDFYPSGWDSTMCWGRLGVDFVCENGAWKIKNMVYAEDIRTPFGVGWDVKRAEKPADPAFASVAEVKIPEPTVKCTVHELWNDRRQLRAFPRIPEPFDTFGETFSYGYEEAGA